MGSATKHQTRPNPNSTASTSTSTENPNDASTSAMELDSPPPLTPFTIDSDHQDLVLSNSKFLTRREVIRRRHRRLKRQIQIYEDYYWGLMEVYRAKHREYYWEHGKSPFQEDGDEEVEMEKSGDESEVKFGFGSGKSKRCGYIGCTAKAMVLTEYCHSHILEDGRQKLYKACKYGVKSPHTGPEHCGKPILNSAVPSLCAAHFEKAQIHVTRALKQAGLNISSASKLAPKFHTIVSESVQQINTKRQRKTNFGNGATKEEHTIGGIDAVMEENTSVGNGVVEENAD